MKNTDRMNAKFNPPPKGPCQKCHRSPATSWCHDTTQRFAACQPCANAWWDGLTEGKA